MENIVIVEEKKIEKQDDNVEGEENKKDTAKGKQKLIKNDEVNNKETEEEIDTDSSEEHVAQELETKGNKRKIKEKQKENNGSDRKKIKV